MLCDITVRCPKCGRKIPEWAAECLNPKCCSGDENRTDDENCLDTPLSPRHYSRFKIQPMDFIVENGLDYLQGNIIKYVVRYDAKNGVEDLEKAKVYLERLIEREKVTLPNVTGILVEQPQAVDRGMTWNARATGLPKEDLELLEKEPSDVVSKFGEGWQINLRTFNERRYSPAMHVHVGKAKSYNCKALRVAYDSKDKVSIDNLEKLREQQQCLTHTS